MPSLAPNGHYPDTISHHMGCEIRYTLQGHGFRSTGGLAGGAQELGNRKEITKETQFNQNLALKIVKSNK